MKKRKPYSLGRVSHPPSAREADTRRPNWLRLDTHTFISLMGKVRWHSRRASWYGYLSMIHHCFYWDKQPNNGFDKARDAMSWVEREFIRRERKRTWKSTD